jgi:hypothetical protein
VLDRQLQLGRIADAATEIYVSLCVLARLDRLLTAPRPVHAAHHQLVHDGHDHGHVPGNGAGEHGAHAAPAADVHAGASEPPHGAHEDEAQKRRELAIGRYYLRTAARRIRRTFADLWDNDDDATVALAKGPS